MSRSLLGSFLAQPPPEDLPYLLVLREGALTSPHGAGARNLDAIALLPGSFNPLHEGHELLAAVAAAQLGREVVYELSVTNVDKPPLAEAEVLRRIAQFAGEARVVLTCAPRFVEKARLFPGCVFVVGWDTFVRLLDARYYDGDAGAMRAALTEMRALGCRFLVAGRIDSGAFRTLQPSDVPPEFADMFEAIAESRFRIDISSTVLRGD